MPITFRNFQESDAPSVDRFNARLRAGGQQVQFSCATGETWPRTADAAKPWQERFIAVDEAGEVRGGYMLKHQDFAIGGKVVAIADCQMPISEGIVDRKYTSVAVSVIFDAIRRQPLMFGLGGGGEGAVAIEYFRAAGWSVFSVPFFFRVVRPVRFFRKSAFLRRSVAKRFVANVLAFTGVGWAAIKALQALRTHVSAGGATAEIVGEFGDWADEVWRDCAGSYGMVAVRDAQVLRKLYPSADGRFIRLRIRQGDETIGWSVMLATQMTNHKQFGSLNVGSLVDCLARPDDAATVVELSKRELERRGADIIVSNQSHSAWSGALSQTGFLSGPSNFAFTASRKLTELVKSSGVANDQIHVNRGDGDGPINL